MISKEDILSFLQEQKDLLFTEYQLVRLGLFGSFARSEESESSDIDLIIEFAPNTKDLFGKKQRLKAHIQRKFNRDVDLCREKYIKPYYKNQLLKSVIYI